MAGPRPAKGARPLGRSTRTSSPDGTVGDPPQATLQRPASSSDSTYDPGKWVSGRETAVLLGLGRDTTRRLLASGLLGEPVVTSTSTLYERSRVEELARRPEVTVAHVRCACPEGIMVGRLDPRRTTPEGPWRASLVVQSMIGLMVEAQGRVPLVVTVGSFVLSCHDVLGCAVASPAGAGRGSYTRLGLREPGTWSRHFEDRLLVTPPGHPLLFWACRAMPPIRPTRRRAAAG